MDSFLRWIHKAMLIRRVILGWALWMTTWITVETWEWVSHIEKPGVDEAAILGSILTPILGLTGFIIKFYAQNPYSDKLPEGNEQGRE